MLLSRMKPAVAGEASTSSNEKKRKNKTKKIPRLEDYLNQRDYLGALTVLEFQRNGGVSVEHADLWIGFCAFHLGDHKRAMEEYKALTLRPECPVEVWVYLGCSLFFLGLYKEAEEAALKGPKTQLQNRLLFHLAHKFSDEKKLMGFHQNLEDVTEDQLSLASIHYMRSHYQEAIDIYKRILLQNSSTECWKCAFTREQVMFSVSQSGSVCNTIPGRQCMASCFFLLKQFEDVLIYLNSVKSYFYNDDTFNFNYAQAKAALGNYREAEEVFLLIQNEKIKNDYVYLSWLSRCYIMNQKARQAWELYLRLETSSDPFSLLQLIANDCYKMGQFYYAAKAFDALERLDQNPEYWEGKRGACVGIFQLILAGRESRETLKEVLPMLRSTGNPQVEYIIRIMKKWAKDNRVAL